MVIRVKTKTFKESLKAVAQYQGMSSDEFKQKSLINRFTDLLGTMQDALTVANLWNNLKEDFKRALGNTWEKEDELGMTLLHWAAVFGLTDEMKELFPTLRPPLVSFDEKMLQFAMRKNAHGETAFHLAAKHNHHPFVQLMINAGAEHNAHGIRNRQGLTPFQVAIRGSCQATFIQFMRYFETLNPAEVTGILDHQVNTSNRVTALILAVESGEADWVKKLLDMKADPNLFDTSYETALHKAAHIRNIKIMRLILSDPRASESLSKKNAQEKTPFACAVATGEMTLIEFFIPQEEGKERVAFLSEALFWACESGMEELIGPLLAAGATLDAIELSENEAVNCVYIAAVRGYASIVNLLLKTDSAKIIAPALAEDGGVISRLLIPNQVTSDNKLAVASELLAFYRKKGESNGTLLAKLKPVLRFVVENNLHQALPMYLGQLHQFMDAAAGIGVIYNELMLVAVKRGYLETFTVLLNSGHCDVNAEVQGGGFIHIAAAKGEAQFIGPLLQAGANINAKKTIKKEKNGKKVIQEEVTPLMMAIDACHVGVVTELLLYVKHLPKVGFGSFNEGLALAKKRHTELREKKREVKRKHPNNFTRDQDYLGFKKQQANLEAIIAALKKAVKCYNQYKQLIAACKAGDIEKVKQFHRAGADLEASTYDEGQPILVAVLNNQPEVVGALVKAGINVSLVDPSKGSVLHICAREGLVDVAELLLQKKHLGLLDPHALFKGKTPFEVAQELDQTGILALFNARGIGKERTRTRDRIVSQEPLNEGQSCVGGNQRFTLSQLPLQMLVCLSGNGSSFLREWKPEVDYTFTNSVVASRHANQMVNVNDEQYVVERVDSGVATTATNTGEEIQGNGLLSKGAAMRRQLATDAYAALSNGSYIVASFALAVEGAPGCVTNWYMLSTPKNAYASLEDLTVCRYSGSIPEDHEGCHSSSQRHDGDCGGGGGGGGGGKDDWDKAPESDMEDDEESVKSFGEIVKNGHLPTMANIDGYWVPILGLPELIAVARLLSDVNPLGIMSIKECNETVFNYAGFVVETGNEKDMQTGKLIPIAIRMVKIGSQMPFYLGDQNKLASFWDVKKKNKTISDSTDIQLGPRVGLSWKNMTTDQQGRFNRVLNFGIEFLSKPGVLDALLDTAGVIAQYFSVKIVPTDRVDWEDWLESVKTYSSAGTHNTKSKVAHLYRIWHGSKYREPGSLFSVYKPCAEKSSGVCLGFMVNDISNNKRYLAKKCDSSDGVIQNVETMTRENQKRTHVGAVNEKSAMDTYAFLGFGKFLVAGTRLAVLDASNRFTKTERWRHKLAHYVSRLGVEASKMTLHILSAWMPDFKPLSELRGCLKAKGGKGEISFLDCVIGEAPYIPEWIRVMHQGKSFDVPFVGLMEMLAAARCMADTDVLGLKTDTINGQDVTICDNAGYIVETDSSGNPVLVRAVKIDAGEAYHVGRRDLVNNYKRNLRLVLKSGKKPNIDLRDLQLGNTDSLFKWESLSKNQKAVFLRSLQRFLAILRKDNVMEILRFRQGHFEKFPGAKDSFRMHLRAILKSDVLESWRRYLDGLDAVDGSKPDVYGSLLAAASPMAESQEPDRQSIFKPVGAVRYPTSELLAEAEAVTATNGANK